jgi:hypothetical protein
MAKVSSVVSSRASRASGNERAAAMMTERDD